MKLRNELLASDNALAFLRALVAGQALDAENVLEVVQSPWKWQREYELWHEHGKPSDGDDSFHDWCADVDEAA
jgi:hypothetical protein